VALPFFNLEGLENKVIPPVTLFVQKIILQEKPNE
jgi:hypothetical protein